MPRIAFVNGAYVPHSDASIHIEDRGCQLADGVYEVIALKEGRPVDLGPHLDRLDRSLAELRIPWPMGRGPLSVVLREVTRRNGIGDGTLYLQISRGVAKREHAFPPAVHSSLVVVARRHKLPTEDMFERGVAVISIPDLRWKRCDIKSVALLPNVLGKQQAKEAGVFEAWMIGGDGWVTEGTSSNAWIVSPSGDIVTRPAGPEILNGITRSSVLRLARAQGLAVAERPFSLAEAKAAAEAFLTSTTTFVMPVVTVDGMGVGDGRPGPVTRTLRRMYLEHLAAGGASW